MPLATSSLILQNTSLDLILLPTRDALFGAVDRSVSTVKIKAGTTATTVDIGATSLSLQSDSPIFVKQGTSLSFSGDATNKFRRQVIINEDVLLNNTPKAVRVYPLLRPIVSTAALIDAETVGVANLRFAKNYKNSSTISVTSSSTVLTASTGNFAAVEVGDTVSQGGTFVATVVSKRSNTVLTISTAPGTAFSNTSVVFASNSAAPLLSSISSITNTSGSASLSGSNDLFALVEVGDLVSGTGVADDTYVLSKQSNNSITLNKVSTSGITSATFVSRIASTPLTGIQTLDLNNQETQVDTTHFGSGAGTEAAIVRFNRSYSASGIALIGDEALERIVKRVAGFDNAFLGREVYAIATTSDGEAIEGAAKIMALNLPANQNEVKKYSFTLMYQGNAAWVQPYSY
jgi:hypothetical protein